MNTIKKVFRFINEVFLYFLLMMLATRLIEMLWLYFKA